MLHTMLAVDILSGKINSDVAQPLLSASKFLIPAFVVISGLHKLMEHRESGGAFLLEMLLKGGGAVLLITVIQELTKAIPAN